jgi:6-carboxyhexanoate--CoA ligase
MEELYSLRMRASKQGEHISGAEKIISEQELNSNMQQLVTRAREHSQGQAGEINITIEQLDQSELKQLRSLAITTIDVADYQAGRRKAKSLLQRLDLKTDIVDKAINLLATGPSPSGANMRGSVLLDIETGSRLEPDQSRGIRATKMDYQAKIRDRLSSLLVEHGLNQSHLPEALAVATKVVSHPQIVAELCISDDPDYQAGYVASSEFGYCRFPYLKPAAKDLGGRIFFVDFNIDLEEVIDYLEEAPVLIDQLNPQVRSCF